MGATSAAYLLASAALAAFAPAAARAQASASLAVDSDYQLRGVSLTDRRPAASLDLAYDFRNGAYAGGSAIVADRHGDVATLLGHIEYLGYAMRAGERTLDLGVSDSALTSYVGVVEGRRIHYSEAYAAVSSGGLRFAVQYSPNYIASHTQAFYFDLSGSARPAPGWRVFAHAGWLDPVIRQSGPGGFRSRMDWRAGVSRDFPHANLHLAWTSRTGAAAPGKDRAALVAGADFFF